jgi:sugar lactone lactonase YvrE
MEQFACELLYRPESAELRYLPEGPYPVDEHRFSWVAIQHGADAQCGSLNVFDLAARQNRSYPLDGRPGFAFATSCPDVYVIGLDHRLQLYDTRSGEFTTLNDSVDSETQGTIINDGVVFDRGLVFGCKDLAFRDRKAGLYLWRKDDQQLIRLRSDQICSNGKIIVPQVSGYRLLDIDTPTRTVVAYDLDVDAGRLSEAQIALDLRDDPAYPDGMVATPDGAGVIIAFYNPGQASVGVVRQYRLADGAVQAEWIVPGVPQVTCPQLVQYDGAVRLIVTTAIEHMTPERLARCPDTGCLFIADTFFTSLPDTPPLSID